MTAPDGREFTFSQWCDYLKEPGHDTNEPYRSKDGKIYQVDGFQFNVHGYCLNPHIFRLAPPDERVGNVLTYCDFRTYRKAYSKQDRRVVWWFDAFGMNSGIHAFGCLEPEKNASEEDTILAGLKKALESQDRQIEWYDSAIAHEEMYAEQFGDRGDTGYRTSKRRVEIMRELVQREIINRSQLTLF